MKGKHLGYIGRISPEKNIIELIHAIKILKDKNIDIILKLYGDAKNIEYKNRVDELIVRLDLTKVVYL